MVQFKVHLDVLRPADESAELIIQLPKECSARLQQQSQVNAQRRLNYVFCLRA
jgi:hypothetical protein